MLFILQKYQNLHQFLQQGHGPASPKSLAFSSDLDLSRVAQVQKLDHLTTLTDIATFDGA